MYTHTTGFLKKYTSILKVEAGFFLRKMLGTSIDL